MNNDNTQTHGKRFFIYADGRQQGPYGIHELKGHGLSSETLVWHEDMDGWTPAWQVTELRRVLDGKDEVEDDTPAAVTQDADRESASDEALDTPVIPAGLRKGRRTRRSIVLIALCILLAAMSLTCPGEDAHKDAVNREVMKTIDKISDNNGSWGIISNIMASGIASIAVDRMLEVEDYVFFSIGSIHYGDRSRTVSFGIFNHVFTFDAEYIGRSEELRMKSEE